MTIPKSKIMFAGTLFTIAVLMISGCTPIAQKATLVPNTPLPTLSLAGVTAVGAEKVNPNDPLSRGEVAYDTYCAHCHGYKGEGEGENIDPNKTDAIGFMPVPRHDSKGHTWMHPDQLLKATVRQGIANPLDRYNMPAMPVAALSDSQLDDIFLYIKQWWTQEQRDFQANITEKFGEAQKK
jgi:mono/diheme cytochrome c family protein